VPDLKRNSPRVMTLLVVTGWEIAGTWQLTGVLAHFR